MQSLWGSETALQDYHSCPAPTASRKAWRPKRMDAGNVFPTPDLSNWVAIVLIPLFWAASNIVHRQCIN